MTTSRYHYSIFTPYNNRYFHLAYTASTQLPGFLSIAYDVVDAGLYSSYSSYIEKKNYKENFDLLPMAVRYASEYKDFYVIERPPFQIEVDYSKNSSYRHRKSFKNLESATMWIPWTVSFIKFPTSFNYNDFSFELYFNNKPLTSLDDKLVHCWLPNTSSSRVCLGQDQVNVVQLLKNASSITDIYNQMFNSFFAGWNSDLIPTFLDTPFLSNFTSNLSSKKDSPKNIASSVNEWYSRSKSKALQNILYTFSNMQIEQMFEYIESVKKYDSQLEDDSYYKNRYAVSYSSLLDNKSFYKSIQSRLNTTPNFADSSYPQNSYYAYYKFNDLLNSIIISSGSKNLYKYRFQVQIFLDQKISQDSDSNDCVSINDFIDNPYIISKIFLKCQDILVESAEDYSSSISTYSQVVTIEFNLSEVIQYNIPRKENSHANAS